MAAQHDASRFAPNPAENYQRYFVPSIGRPSAEILFEAADLRPREDVLDVACGTGVVTRMAREAVGPECRVVGLDLNPGMIEVARRSTPDDLRIEYIEASAEDMPPDDGTFDVVLCAMGLQFFADREAGLREMRRVLAGDGRVVVSLPGPIPPLFRVFEGGLRRHLGPEAAAFAARVFSLHEEQEIRRLVAVAGFTDARVASRVETLTVPAPEAFLWQYVHSTPLAGALATADDTTRTALERDVCEGWREFERDGEMRFDVRMTTVVASG